MKNLAKVCCLLFMSYVCIAQQNDENELRPQYPVPIKKEIKKEPIIYKVHEASFEQTTKADIVPILNKDYVILERKIKILEKDSIYYNSKLESAIKKQNDLLSIRTMINEFLVSSDSFENKKEKLIDAQKLSDQHSLNELIYADSKINTKQSTDFLILQIDDLFLERHLKKVLMHIEGMFEALPRTDAYVINQYLKNLRGAIKGIEKYRYSTGTYKNIIRDGLFVSKQIDEDEFLSDDFEQLGTHFILYNGYKDKFYKGELIDHNTAVAYNLVGSNHGGGSWELFRQKNTGMLYLIDFNFADEHAFFVDGKLDKYKLPLVTNDQDNVVMTE